MDKATVAAEAEVVAGARWSATGLTRERAERERERERSPATIRPPQPRRLPDHPDPQFPGAANSIVSRWMWKKRTHLSGYISTKRLVCGPIREHSNLSDLAGRQSADPRPLHTRRRPGSTWSSLVRNRRTPSHPAAAPSLRDLMIKMPGANRCHPDIKTSSPTESLDKIKTQ
jgi:hypothetical protein